MAHYYDKNVQLKQEITNAQELEEIARRDKIGLTRQKQMKKAIKSCIQKFEGLKVLYKKNSNFKFANQRENDLGLAKAQLKLSQLYRVSSIELDKYHPKKEKHTVKARKYCEEAHKLFTDLEEQNGIAKCAEENAKVSLAFKSIYPTTISDFEGNIANSQDAKTHFHEAFEIYDWTNSLKSLKHVEEEVKKLDESIAFSRIMVKRLNIAHYGPTEDDSDEEEAAELKQEADAVKKVFDRFDADGSGNVDMEEFHEIAAALGTFPPLTEHEIEESRKQLGKGNTVATFSWDEFLCWWISAQLLVKEQGVKDGIARVEHRDINL